MIKKVNFILLMAVLLPVLALAKPTIEKPTIKGVSSFANVSTRMKISSFASYVTMSRPGSSASSVNPSAKAIS